MLRGGPRRGSPGDARAVARARGHTDAMFRRTAWQSAAVALLAAAGAAVLPAQTALAATPAERVTVATGHDVSYPQCGRELPARGDIAVVGVNAGTGTTTNPCLAEQLAWGDAPAADGSARLADVYVNTANPGHLGGWWPRSDLTRTGLPVTNPEGRCIGAEDAACSYVYGWSIAADDALRRGVPHPEDRTWWLDVETMNSWSWNRDANLAVLEGMADAFRQVGGRVGVYSTTRQWASIVGRATPGSALAGVPSWNAGAVTRAGAEDLCRAAPFTPGGRTVMAQWVQDDQDHDVSCTAGVAGSTPSVSGTAAVGGRLLAESGAWGPAGVGLAYRWLRDGVPIPGATAPVYVPVAADAGAALSLRMTGSRAGAPSLSLTSAAVAVAAAEAPSTPSGSPAAQDPTGSPTAPASPSADPAPGASGSTPATGAPTPPAEDTTRSA